MATRGTREIMEILASDWLFEFRCKEMVMINYEEEGQDSVVVS